MTDAQKQAWTSATELLKEHFDNVVLIIDTEADDNTDRLFDAMWDGGGISMAIGLCERAKLRLMSFPNTSDPTD